MGDWRVATAFSVRDAALESVLGDDDSLFQAHAAALEMQYGPDPVSAEPSTLCVVASSIPGVFATVYAPCRIDASDIIVRTRANKLWVTAGTALIYELAFTSARIASSSPGELHACVTSLASRLRVAASFGTIGKHDAVPLSCVIAPLGDAVCVSITLPATLPPTSLIGWCYRIDYASLGGAALQLQDQQPFPRVVGGHTHSASCKHRKAPEGLVLSAAAAGSVPALAAALSSGGSTEETNKVACLSRMPTTGCMLTLFLQFAERHVRSEHCSRGRSR